MAKYVVVAEVDIIGGYRWRDDMKSDVHPDDEVYHVKWEKRSGIESEEHFIVSTVEANGIQKAGEKIVRRYDDTDINLWEFYIMNVDTGYENQYVMYNNSKHRFNFQSHTQSSKGYNFPVMGDVARDYAHRHHGNEPLPEHRLEKTSIFHIKVKRDQA